MIGALYAYPLDTYKDKDGTDTLELVEAHTRNNMLGIKPENEKEEQKELEDKTPEAWIKEIRDIDDESLTELIHQGMLKMLQRMHDERSPLDVVEIQDKFVNTLLTLAEHLN
ncbi:MAG: hypothetical protein WAM14_16820, partial [Candidatus Nitrosopolaris sp.]